MLSKLSWCLLAIATSAVSAVNLSTSITYAFTISDFQGHMLDLTNGNNHQLTPVQSFTPANTTNQQWALISTQDARQLWELFNLGSNTIMSHTTAMLKRKGTAIHAQIVGSNETLFWRLDNSPEGSRFTDASTGLALTAWSAEEGYPSSPLTLEYASGENKRQIFHLHCMKALSIPGDC
ncbi:hypothetical protein C8F04DRAFT_1104153 [Mycena alexandri]|uniref:Ricin B lectin domain-containing protein n=1 Tax=Mycena alexandri TaxID=1745969 RepID=A0AAD6X2Z9_9AGAR|nr:hypothetical protein C8F04DRAFT_1104153 [Mycena alexandri]